MSEPQRTIIKHPNSAYLIVAFVLLCVTAVVRSPWLALIYLIPLGGAWYVARTATIVDADGITARAMFGSYTVAWPELTGLRLSDSSAVYAVARDGTQTRLPCVRATKLTPLIAASAGRIPDPATEADHPVGHSADLPVGHSANPPVGHSPDDPHESVQAPPPADNLPGTAERPESR